MTYLVSGLQYIAIASAATSTDEYLADRDLLEYVCAENEKDRGHLVGKKSDETKHAVKLAREVLSEYVGTYERQISDDLRAEIIIALEDDGLTMTGLGIAKVPLTALSETTFSASGILLEFGKNDKGEVTYFIQHAAADLRADRKK